MGNAKKKRYKSTTAFSLSTRSHVLRRESTLDVVSVVSRLCSLRRKVRSHPSPERCVASFATPFFPSSHLFFLRSTYVPFKPAGLAGRSNMRRTSLPRRTSPSPENFIRARRRIVSSHNALHSN